MATALGDRMVRPRTDILLNLVIVVLVFLDAVLALSVFDGRAAEPLSQPLPVAPPTTMAPQLDAAEGVSSGTVGREGLEAMQSSLVVAQALEIEHGRPVAAADLVSAFPELSFVNGLTAAGSGVIGVLSNDDGILLLTEGAGETWLCAASDASGSSVLGAAGTRDDLATVSACMAHPV
ncbi:MAG: hypothetical protein ACE5GC_09035 [Acidimicrobiia bacterium]